MTEAQLRELLSEETLAWAERPPVDITAELTKPQTFRRGSGDAWHEIEVTLLEATDDYIHVKTSIHVRFEGRTPLRPLLLRKIYR